MLLNNSFFADRKLFAAGADHHLVQRSTLLQDRQNQQYKYRKHAVGEIYNFLAADLEDIVRDAFRHRWRFSMPTGALFLNIVHEVFLRFGLPHPNLPPQGEGTVTLMLLQVISLSPTGRGLG